MAEAREFALHNDISERCRSLLASLERAFAELCDLTPQSKPSKKWRELCYMAMMLELELLNPLLRKVRDRIETPETARKESPALLRAIPERLAEARRAIKTGKTSSGAHLHLVEATSFLAMAQSEAKQVQHDVDWLFVHMKLCRAQSEIRKALVSHLQHNSAQETATEEAREDEPATAMPTMA